MPHRAAFPWLKFCALILLTGWPTLGWAAVPFVLLGPADQLALDQPRVAVQLAEPDTGRVIGPEFANVFLLDTGANSVLAVDDAVDELIRGGYRTEGTFFEQGVAGFTPFDVSAPYELQFAAADGATQSRPNTRILSSTTTSFCPLPGFCSFFGVLGMPAMEGRVTTLDLSSITGGATGGTIDIFDLLDNLAIDFMKTTFASQLPATPLRRYSIELTPFHLDPEGEAPLPVWADIPFLTADPVHAGVRRTGQFVLDTGAQLSVLSSRMAFDLGLDANGNGNLLDEAVGVQPIGGIGGQVDAPVMLVDELRVPTEQGFELVFTNLEVAILDIAPEIDGLFGMNFLSSGWLGSLFGDLGELGELLEDAGFGDLLGELGLSGLGDGATSPYFQKVHFDLRQWPSRGVMYLDILPGVAGVTIPEGTHGDLDDDGDIDFGDRVIWVEVEHKTYFGDANLDGQFDTKDLIQVFRTNEYEDGVLKNSTWQTGDWNGDGEFDSKDLVVAFQSGGYEQGPRAAGVREAAVPEPSALGLALLAAIVGLPRRTRCLASRVH